MTAVLQTWSYGYKPITIQSNFKYSKVGVCFNTPHSSDKKWTLYYKLGLGGIRSCPPTDTEHKYTV